MILYNFLQKKLPPCKIDQKSNMKRAMHVYREKKTKAIFSYFCYLDWESIRGPKKGVEIVPPPSFLPLSRQMLLVSPSQKTCLSTPPPSPPLEKALK